MEKVENNSSVAAESESVAAVAATSDSKEATEGEEDAALKKQEKEKTTEIMGSTSTKFVKKSKSLSSPAASKIPATGNWKDDYQVLQKLGTEYRQMLKVKQMELLSTFQSAKQTAWGSIAYLVILFTCGTAFVKAKSDVPMSQAILFSVYTFTSAGFGNVDIPNTRSFLIFVIFYVYASISALAILVAQTFQYFELQTTRWKHTLAKAKYAVEGESKLAALKNQNPSGVDQRIREGLLEALKVGPKPFLLASSNDDKSILLRVLRVPWFAVPSVVKAILFMAFILLLGAIVMMNLEGWTFVEGFYFATFAMTTIGYGDLFPTKPSSTWFVNFWLPFNVAFLAVYLSTVAHYYVRFGNWNAARIERQLQKLQHQPTETTSPTSRATQKKHPTPPPAVSPTDNNNGSKPIPKASVQGNEVEGVAPSCSVMDVEQDSTSVASNIEPSIDKKQNLTTFVPDIGLEDGISRAPTTPLLEDDSKIESKMTTSSSVDDSGVSSHSKRTSLQHLQIPDLLTIFSISQDPSLEHQHGLQRRERIRQISLWDISDHFFTNPQHETAESDNLLDGTDQIQTTLDLLNYFSLPQLTDAASLAAQEQGNEVGVPGMLNLKIHFKVLERLARIVAAEAKNVLSEVEINGEILSVTMDHLKDAALQWLIPNRAREAFKSVFFSSLMYVGEKDVLFHGVDAFFKLNPLQFHSVFGPFVTAMEDTDTMISWLVKTQSMRDRLLASTTTNPVTEDGTALVYPNKSATFAESRRNRRSLKNKIEAYFPPNPGNVVRIKM